MVIPEDIHFLVVRILSPTSCEPPQCILLSVTGGVESSWVVDDPHGRGGGYWKAERDESGDGLKWSCVGGFVSSCWVRRKRLMTQ